MFTIYDIAQRFKEQLDVDIPHPKVETTYAARDLGVNLPCPVCDMDYECGICDQFIELVQVTDTVLLPKFLTSKYSYIRTTAQDHLNMLLQR